MFKDRMEAQGKPLAFYFRKFSLPDVHKLLVLQVISGIKNAATFDGIPTNNSELLGQIKLLFNYLGLYSRIVERGNVLKVIFGRKEEDVLLLYALQDKVFNERKFRIKYGRLLGYPACCTKQFVLKRQEQKSFPLTSMRRPDPLGARWVADHKFNILSKVPLIFHVPCAWNCAASRALAQRALRLYEAYDPVLVRTIIKFLKEPVLVFNIENFVRFSGRLVRNSVQYSGIQHVHTPCFADGNKSFESVEINHIVGAINSGNNLSFNKKEFAVFRNSKLLKRVKYSDQQFQFYDFC